MSIGKIELNDYRELAESFGLKYILKEVPDKTTDTIKGWKCDTEGHLMTTSYNQLLYVKGCQRCLGKFKKTIDDYNALAAKWNLKFIGEEIIDTCKPNSYQCVKHDTIIDVSYRGLDGRKTSPCEQCRIEANTKFVIFDKPVDKESNYNFTQLRQLLTKHGIKTYGKNKAQMYTAITECYNEWKSSVEDESKEDDNSTLNSEENINIENDGKDEEKECIIINEPSSTLNSEEENIKIRNDGKDEEKEYIIEINDNESSSNPHNQLSIYQVAEICQPYIYENLIREKTIISLVDFISKIGLTEDMFRVDEYWDAWKHPAKFMVIDKPMLDWLGYEGEHYTQRQSALRGLRENFQEGIDFIYQHSIGAMLVIGAERQPKKAKLFAVSYPCLLQWSMSMQTTKGKEIRRQSAAQQMLFHLYDKYQLEFSLNQRYQTSVIPNENIKIIQTIEENMTLFNCALKLPSGDNYVIPVRNDSYVYATGMCKAGGKRYNHWFDTKQTQDLISALSLNTGIPVFKLIESHKGKYGGSWIHPDLAINLAQYCSPSFAVQVSRWIRETRSNNLVENTKIIQTNEENMTLFNCEVILPNGNNFILPIRKDAYINATLACKAHCKRVDNWLRLDQTNTLIEAVKRSTSHSRDTLIQVIKTGPNEFRGTYIHPDLQVPFGMWLNVDFSVQVSRWIRELLLTGKVELGKEKSLEELDSIWKTKYFQLESDKKLLIENHVKLLEQKDENIEQRDNTIRDQATELVKYKRKAYSSEKAHRYLRFKLDSCYYGFTYGRLCSDGCRTKKLMKHGIAIKGKAGSSSIDKRMRQHRVTFKFLIVEFIISGPPDAIEVIEDSMAVKFGANLNPNSSEIFESVSSEALKLAAISMLEIMCPGNYTIISQEQINQYNSDVDLMVKEGLDPIEEEDDIDECENDKIDPEDIPIPQIIINDNSADNSTTNNDNSTNVHVHIDVNLEELRQLLKDINTFTVKKLNPLLEKFKISKHGTKEKKIEKLVDYIKNTIKGFPNG